MTKITLEQWRMFKAVVEYGGFNQAAKAVYKSQSSVHTAVQKIEQTLGVKLFKVEGRKTLLTEAGTAMLRRAEYLLEEAEKLEAVGQTLGQGIESHLRIAVDEVFPKSILYQALESTSLQFPLLRIEVFESVLSGTYEQFQQRLVDVAISVLPEKGFSESTLFTVEFVAVAHVDHALHQFSRTLALEDLKSHRQIVIRDSGTSKRIDHGWLEAEQRWTVDQLSTSIDMVCNGLGFAWLPVHAIQDRLDNGTLKALALANGMNRTVSLHTLVHDEDDLGPAAQFFLNSLRTICSS
ncbi:LysR family transcriptional regulator (plasmid) [Pseudoalteromonas sp. T1lg65]|uniref:LysR family transcriptional regulator n=1 Tax=Pseudoalteromonas sp. T1lg65 TaxID=2077101 RepID=UPI003F794877